MKIAEILSFSRVPVFPSPSESPSCPHSDTLRDRRILTRDEQAEFDNIQLICDNMGALIGTSSRNLEQLSSFLAVQNINDPTFRYEGNTKYIHPPQASALIHKCIYKLVTPTLNIQTVDNIKKLLTEEYSKEFNISFITTNYDMVIETMGLAANRRISPTASIRKHIAAGQESGSFYSPHMDHPRIFKLHGSVNWYEDDDNDLTVDYLFDDSEGSHKRRCGTFQNDPKDAVIVPPSVIKPRIDRTLKEQWQGANNALKHADAIWFIGYSFPESDSFMRYFLASALASNVQIRQLVVIDPDISVKSRCQRIFRSERLKSVFTFRACCGLFCRVALNSRDGKEAVPERRDGRGVGVRGPVPDADAGGRPAA